MGTIPVAGDALVAKLPFEVAAAVAVAVAVAAMVFVVVVVA